MPYHLMGRIRAGVDYLVNPREMPVELRLRLPTHIGFGDDAERCSRYIHQAVGDQRLAPIGVAYRHGKPLPAHPQRYSEAIEQAPPKGVLVDRAKAAALIDRFGEARPGG